MQNVGGLEELHNKIKALRNELDDLVKKKREIEKELLNIDQYIGKYYKRLDNEWYMRIDRARLINSPYTEFEGVVMYPDGGFIRISYTTVPITLPMDNSQVIEITKEEFYKQFDSIIKYLNL